MIGQDPPPIVDFVCLHNFWTKSGPIEKTALKNVDFPAFFERGIFRVPSPAEVRDLKNLEFTGFFGSLLFLQIGPNWTRLDQLQVSLEIEPFLSRLLVCFQREERKHNIFPSSRSLSVQHGP